MTDLCYSTGTELEQFLYEKCRQDPDLLATIINEYVTSLSDNKLIEQLNNTWKVNYIESGHPSYPQLEIDGGRKYIKVWQFDNYGDRKGNRSIYLFVDKETGAVYKPASTKAPAKGIRFYLDYLLEHPETCDAYGSFLYRR